jgi:hypothetical protein
MAIQSALVRRLRGAAVVSLFVLSGQALGAIDAQRDRDGLMGRYPGLRVSESNGRPLYFYGKPMTTAGDSRLAADTWLSNHGSAFGAGDLSLRYEWENDLTGGRLTVLTYSQQMDGLPVEFGMVKIVVLNGDQGHTVVSAGAKLAPRPEGGFEHAAVTSEQAVATVRAVKAYRTLPLWSDPELVVYFGEGDFAEWITPVRAWKFVGEQPDGAFSRKFTFFVDAATGNLVHARNEILNIDVTGRVMANATPSPFGNAAADHAGNPPQLRGVPNIRVRINGSNATSAFTDADGNFTIPWSGTAPVTLDCSVGDGQWARTVDAVTPVQTATTSATPGTPATLTLNTAPDQFTTAQVNAFIHQTSTHNFIKAYAPNWGPGSPTGESSIDVQFPANVQVSGTCNAFYNGTSTNFYNVGGGCNNTAFSSVVAHEYGHHIVNRLGLAQNAFGEGFGDCVSILQYDDFVVGRYFRTTGGAVRTPDTTNRQYPCSGCAVHTGGEVLGGVMCEIRRNYGTKYGSGPGLERARQDFLDWARITLGGEGTSDSAHPATLAQWLTINDDDGDLDNGTPDQCELLNAFGQHGIQGQGGVTVAFTFPDGLPTSVQPGSPASLRFDIANVCSTATPNSGRVFWRRAGVPTFTQIVATPVGANQYSAAIPAQDCGNVVEYYFQVGTSTGNAYSPASGSGPGVASYLVFDAVGTATVHNFEQANGWALGETTATTGAWVRVDPNGTIAQPENDNSAVGTMCWVTGQATAGAADGTADIDGGYTTLNSPAFDVSGFSDAEVSYYRWYSNGESASSPFADTFRIDVSTDGGATWTRAETVGPGSASDPNTNPGWRYASWRLSQFSLTPTAGVRVRFIAEDAGAGSLVEAAIDDFSIRGLNCATQDLCYADFNQDGGIDGSDVTAFFDAWSAGEPVADVNADGGVDGSDVETFFLAWENGGC